MTLGRKGVSCTRFSSYVFPIRLAVLCLVLLLIGDLYLAIPSEIKNLYGGLLKYKRADYKKLQKILYRAG